MSDEIPSRGPEVRAVLENRDVPDVSGGLDIVVRTFEGERLLSENNLGGPQISSGRFSNALENQPPPRKGRAAKDKRQEREQEPPRPATAPCVEVVFSGSFGEIAAPYASVKAADGMVILTQSKDLPFRYTPARTAEGDPGFDLRLPDGSSHRVVNPGMSFDRDCPCCGARERVIVLLTI